MSPRRDRDWESLYPGSPDLLHCSSCPSVSLHDAQIRLAGKCSKQKGYEVYFINKKISHISVNQISFLT